MPTNKNPSLRFRNHTLPVAITPRIVAASRLEQKNGCSRARCCPNAKAITQALGRKYRRHHYTAQVVGEYFNVYEDGKFIAQVAMPDAGIKVVKEFDHKLDNPVTPVKFNIDLGVRYEGND